ncbi:discoidin domain-containing protein [Streptomyces sp. NPDC004787]|uniref:discoidin domain-containing protein n=1 Tax=Streptomyces sp. NPDC004787 TaxID=3154291 RepID=UPI0033B86810
MPHLWSPPARRHPDARPLRPARRATVGALVAALAGGLLAVVPAAPATAAPTLLSQGKAATASSAEGPFTAPGAVDGDLTGTRWASDWSDAQWFQVDLGQSATLGNAVLTWETAYGKSYEIQASENGTDWRTVTTVTNGDGGTDDVALSGTGRYVRMKGLTRGTVWGYSLWEFQVYGTSGGGTTLPGGGDLGPNVHVVDPSTPGIQARLDEVFRQQESAQFGTGRHAFLFKPGTYQGLNAQIGFYTQIAGLGLRPDDTTINGDVTVDAGWFNGNATQNFWRGAEGLALNPVNGTDRWAVSQASSFRRMHVKGGLNLAPTGYGWASGGYIADSRIDGQVGNYSQQQWYTRDSSIGGGWSNSVWNQVFSGTEGAPAQSFPEPKYTTLDTTPVSREKPYLIWQDNQFKVFSPAKRVNARGTTWAGGTPQGETIPLSRFYVVRPGTTAATVNQALAQGLHLLFTPGIYHVDRTIEVNRPGTVVLGLGLATIIPDNGVTALRVADVDGVRLAGFLVDAGPVNSPTLLEIGPQNASADHSADPTTVQDVYVRVGGAGAGKATTGIVVNNDDTLVDHTWVWRADHGDGVGWETNRADYGVRVNGDDVLATGLFVEHFNKYDVEWYGDRGRTIFFQNEKAYDAPNQAAIQNGTTKGYAAYRVDDSVTTHEGWGLGSYCYYNVDPTIRQDHGFRAPVKPGVRFHGLLTVSLGGNGQFEHVINDIGAPTQGTSTIPSTVVSFP